MRIEITGEATADDGFIFDGLYLKSPANVLTVAGFSMADFQNPFDRAWGVPNALPAFGEKSGGRYNYNMTRAYGTQNTQKIAPAAGVQSRNWTPGSITLKIYDLGAT